MKSSNLGTLVTLLGLVVGYPKAVLAQPAVLSAFEGSVELGSYSAEFDRLAYGLELGNNSPVEYVEGALLSRIFEKPEGRSNFEVFSSYKNELARNGFTIRYESALTTPMSFRLKQIYDPPHTPSFRERVYNKTDGSGVVSPQSLAFVVGMADHYLLASRTSGGVELWVAVMLSKSKPLYMIEELRISAREEGTVKLDLEALRAGIENAGKLAIYDIHFATGSAEIEATSADALAVIAIYLKETPGGFYIVGHTDDTGSLESNLSLSKARAAAVKQALSERHGIDGGRLETRGVGPLSPVSTNISEAGRALNRRVEIVQRLP